MPMPLAMSIPLSVLMRIGIKAVVDFSGCLLMRNPYELGGIYFSFNLMTTQVSVPVCVYLYFKYYDGANKLDETMTWIIAITLLLLWLAAFSFLIFYVIVPEYRKTFWSFQTGWQKSQAFFLDNEDNEERRIVVFNNIQANWKSIEEDVKAWTHANWNRWEEEQPEWFTPARKATIPDEFIPAAAVKALGGAQRERRGSARLSASLTLKMQRR
jgi:hypothetical protein